MKLLLTSNGITNDSIRASMTGLLGKALDSAHALYIPTAIYGSQGGPGYAWFLLQECSSIGWKGFSILELTAMRSMDGPNWLAALESADAIVLGGGNPLYLSYWLRASGLAERLPSVLERKVYLGISAGSMVAGKSLRYDPETLQKTGVYRDDEYDDPAPLGYASAETLALANLVIRPHMGNEYFPNATFENMQIAAGQVDCPLYAIDDMTAVQVVEDQITVVSEGMWKKY